MSTTTMNALTARFTRSPIRCHWRLIILAGLALTLLCLFWFDSRYPALSSRNGMKIGMTFGVLSGACLYTVLRYYPLRIGKNLYLNSRKGALVGVPMGVCANCAVPTACGVTRGNGRVEVALDFLFSSPTFNPTWS